LGSAEHGGQFFITRCCGQHDAMLRCRNKHDSLKESLIKSFDKFGRTVSIWFRSWWACRTMSRIDLFSASLTNGNGV
jgi:hypothetical protein